MAAIETTTGTTSSSDNGAPVVTGKITSPQQKQSVTAIPAGAIPKGVNFLLGGMAG